MECPLPVLPVLPVPTVTPPPAWTPTPVPLPVPTVTPLPVPTLRADLAAEVLTAEVLTEALASATEGLALDSLTSPSVNADRPTMSMQVGIVCFLIMVCKVCSGWRDLAFDRGGRGLPIFRNDTFEAVT